MMPKRWRMTVELAIIQHQNAVGLLAGAVIITLIGLAAFAFFSPVGPRTAVTGSVHAFRFRETDTGSETIAIVDLSDQQTISVAIPQNLDCRVGDRITLAKTRTRSGQMFAAGRARCERVKLGYPPPTN